MGSLCIKAQENHNKKCSRCSKKDQNNKYKIFTQCSHIICQACIVQIGDSVTTCTLIHKKDNAIAQFSRNVYSSIRKKPISFQLCSKKHKMIWKDQFQLCKQCSIHLHGFQCRLCSQSICTLCSNSFDLHKFKCPNKHSLIWRMTSIPCLMCGVKKHGWSCRDCRWYSCSNCSDTKFNSNNCPNEHPLIWKKQRQICIICKSNEKCFQCQKCSTYFCLKCTNFQQNKSLCPNKHRTVLVQKHTCTKCELQMPGMFCIECDYHFCTRCQLSKYSTNLKSKNESYQSIKITIIQNPLLQFDDFQKKSSVQKMKMAANKMKNIPTIQIQIDQQKSTLDSIAPLHKQILSDPLNIELYLKLANIYREQQNYIEQIATYQKAIEVEQNKQDKDPQIIFRISKILYQRAIVLNYIGCALIVVQKVLKLSQNYETIELIDTKYYWQLRRIQQLILSKQIQKAKQEFQKLQSKQQEQYERIKALLNEDKL